MQKLLLTTGEAAEALSISRTRLYTLIDSGEIRVVHHGRCFKVPVSELHRFINQRIGQAEAAA